MTRSTSPQPLSLLVQQVNRNERKPGEGYIGALVCGLGGDRAEDGKPVNLGFASAGLPAANSALVACNVGEEGGGRAKKKGDDPQRKGEVLDGGKISGQGRNHKNDPAGYPHCRETGVCARRFLHKLCLLAHRFGVLADVGVELCTHGGRFEDLGEFRAILLKLARQGAYRIDAGLIG